MADFADRLKELRQDKKALQRDIAEYLGLTIRAYQHYEAGTRYPDFEGLQKLADFFGVGIDYLTGRTNYWVDTEGNINVKIPPDILNLDTGELKRRLEADKD